MKSLFSNTDRWYHFTGKEKLNTGKHLKVTYIIQASWVNIKQEWIFIHQSLDKSPKKSSGSSYSHKPLSTSLLLGYLKQKTLECRVIYNSGVKDNPLYICIQCHPNFYCCYSTANNNCTWSFPKPFSVIN